MIDRPAYLQKIKTALKRSPITALLGPRQCGKTTLARFLSQAVNATYFDVESPSDWHRLQNPELVLGSLKGIVILDEIQAMPVLFNVLRVLADRRKTQAHYLILGSASPGMIKTVSETLAGRVEFVELAGFDLRETGSKPWKKLWLRGGFPRSYLAKSENDSQAWRENFIRTFLERDIPQLGISIPAPALRRFWTMLAHYHGQTWNASKIAGAMSLSDKTVCSYLNILTGTYMIRQLQPWHENIGKRQLKSIKIYLRDSGILHSLLGLTDQHSLFGHPQVGASWEGFALEQVYRILDLKEAFFWATHSGVEIDLLYFHRGRRYGIEIKFNEAPKVTRSMRIAQEELGLDHLWIIYPGEHRYPVDKKISVWPLQDVGELI
jgi:predicted AAA+ superfamily ATPase